MTRCASFKHIFLSLFLGLSPVAMAAPAFATIMIGGVPADFRPIIINSYQGLPRLGLQDTRGYASAIADRQSTQKNVRDNPEEAQRISQEIAQHSYSIFLLTQLDFFRSNPDCTQGIDAFQAQISQCAGALLSPSQRSGPWASYIRTFAQSLNPQAHADIFCAGDLYCGNTQIERAPKKLPNGKVVRLDEFEQRDLFSRIKNNQLAAFRTYYADKAMPQEAYYVDVADLGDYDFGNQQFNVRLRGRPGSIALSQAFGYQTKAGARPQNAGFKPNPVGLKYTPKNPFEEAFIRDGVPQAVIQVTLPMPSAQARDLVKNRRVFAVVKFGLSPNLDRDTKYNPLNRTKSIAYHYADNKIEFFSDEALTQKVAETVLTQAPAPAAEPEQARNIYKLRADAMLFDARAFHFMRFALADVLPADMERMAYSIPQSERKLFVDVERRIEETTREYPTGSTAKAQQAAQQRKQRAIEGAKWSNYAWTQRASWIPAQRQAYFDYILGYGPQTEPDFSAWPDALSSVNWGVNLATIFPKGYFEVDRASMGLLADAPTRATIQAFVRDVAATYPVKNLTGVYPLGDVRYDQKTKALTFQRWPFAQQKSITFANSVNSIQDGPAKPFVHSDAKSRLVYNYVSSSGLLDGQQTGRVISSCAQSDRRKSRDCGTIWSNFMPVQWYSAYFAFDRELKQPNITVDPQRGQELARTYRGWRLVVEYSEPEMKLVPFTYKARNDTDTTRSEAQTIFASIERVLIISPSNEIIWSKRGSEMKAASAVTQTVAPKAAMQSYSFPKTVHLSKNLAPNAAIYDFLLAKYAPGNLNDRMLDAMISSRWQYEKYDGAPLGGRFFNQSALQPTAQDAAQTRGDFKAWLLKMSAAFPNKIEIEFPMQYASNTVSVKGQCVKLDVVEGAPFRSNTPNVLANQKTQQCRTAYDQTKRKFERCEGYSNAVTNAQVALDKAEAAGCDTLLAQVASAPQASGSCEIDPNVDMAALGQEMQRCMAQMCGSSPQSLAQIQTYSTCVQNAQLELQTQVQAILRGGMSGGTASTSPSAAPAANQSCQSAKRQLTQANSTLQQARCQDAQTLPPEPSCDFASEIIQPDFMPIDAVRVLNTRSCGANRAFFRSDKFASILLPGGSPYSDTVLSLNIALQQPMNIPYDAPIDAGVYGAVNGSTVLTITGLDEGGAAAGTIALKASASDPVFALP